jgi:hypothetical protein
MQYTPATDHKGIFSDAVHKSELVRTSTAAMVNSSLQSWILVKQLRLSRVNRKVGVAAAPAAGDAISVADVANSAAELVGVAHDVGLIKAGISVTAALAAAATVGSVAGPVLSAIGLAKLACDSYSHRESAHTALQPYVYNIIDSSIPKKIVDNPANLATAAEAANYLMSNGHNQFKLMQSNLTTATGKMHSVLCQYLRLTEQVRSYTVMMARWPKIATDSERIHLFTEDYEAFLKIHGKAAKLIERHMKEGGDIYIGLRRLLHFGNYMQCSEIISLHVYQTIQAHDYHNLTFKDPFIGNKFVADHRAFLTRVAERIDAVAATHKKMTEIAQLYRFEH